MRSLKTTSLQAPPGPMPPNTNGSSAPVYPYNVDSSTFSLDGYQPQRVAGPLLKLDKASDRDSKAGFSKTHAQHNVDLSAGFPVTVVEICCFLPNSGQIPAVTDRLDCNGLTTPALAWYQMQGYTSYTRDDVEKASSRLKKQRQKNNKLSTGTGKTLIDKTKTPQNDLATASWAIRSTFDGVQGGATTRQHALLHDIGDSCEVWPTGNDRGLFTIILEIARRYPDMRLTTADIPHILALLPANIQLDCRGFTNHDLETVARKGLRMPKKR